MLVQNIQLYHKIWSTVNKSRGRDIEKELVSLVRTSTEKEHQVHCLATNLWHPLCSEPHCVLTQGASGSGWKRSPSSDLSAAPEKIVLFAQAIRDLRGQALPRLIVLEETAAKLPGILYPRWISTKFAQNIIMPEQQTTVPPPAHSYCNSYMQYVLLCFAVSTFPVRRRHTWTELCFEVPVKSGPGHRLPWQLDVHWGD